MTQVSTIPTTAVVTPTIPTRDHVRDRVVAFADRIHRSADLDAQRAGLTVSRAGLTGRCYRDSRFDTRGGVR